MSPGSLLAVLSSAAFAAGAWTVARYEIQAARSALSGPQPAAGSPAKADTNAPGALTALKIRMEEVERDNQNLRQKLTEAIEAAKPPPQPPDIAEKVSAVRGLTLQKEVVWVPSQPEEITKRIADRIQADIPAAESTARARAWLAMGWAEKEFDYTAAATSIASTTPSGSYDPETNQFYYLQDASLTTAGGRTLFSSALLPVLIAQNFPFAARNWLSTPNDDEARAAFALIRGDANYHNNLYSINDRLPLNNDGPGMMQFPPPEYSPPPFMMVANQFCQDSGASFIEHLSANGGAESLRKAYSRPPRSTAEIIHPGTLYTGAEPFTPADLSVPDAAVSGATPYFTNVAGEFGIATLIHFHAPQEVAAPAAEGWIGDRYWAYAAEGDTGGDHIVWRTRWRSAADAEEFFKAMRRSLMDRYSIPWQQEYDAVPGTFQVNDPRRIIRLTWSAEKKSVLLINAMSPAFATAAAEKFAPLD